MGLEQPDILSKYFSDEDEARKFLENLRWSDGPKCPHCNHSGAYRLTAKESSTSPVRKGVYKCKSCRKQFSVRIGTIFQDSHIPLTKWLRAIYLMSQGGKRTSATELQRTLEISYKSAWLMRDRIEEEMTESLVKAIITKLGQTLIDGNRKRRRKDENSVVESIQEQIEETLSVTDHPEGMTFKMKIRW